MVITTQAGSNLGVLRDQKDRSGHDGKAIVHALHKQLMENVNTFLGAISGE